MIPILVMLALAADAPFTTVARGSASSQQTPRQVTVRTAAEWGDLWKSHAPAQKVPAIDFSTRMVVGVFLGTQPTAGIEVEIVAVRTDTDTLVVEYVERRPGRDMMAAQILTEPFHLVSVPTHEGPVRFVRVTSPGR
jgi:hypothetical protein